MKSSSFVLSLIALIVSVATAIAVGWLYIEKKVKYITTDDNF